MKTGHNQHLSDQEILSHFYSDHNNEWLGILLQRYTLLLLGVCMKYLKNEDEAKDAVQQVFLKTIQELRKYKVDYFKSWLYMVCKNHCLMKIREKHGKHTIEVNDGIIAAADELQERSELWHKDLTLDLMQASLQELNEEQQQCVTLFYLQKKSYHEVSQTTGYSMLQVKSYIQNGKRNLKLLIQKKLEERENHKKNG